MNYIELAEQLGTTPNTVKRDFAKFCSKQAEKEFSQLIVDHINGIRNDNRLINLRWGTSEENTLWMNMNRKEITTETTRLINKYGYEKTLEILKSIK